MSHHVSDPQRRTDDCGYETVPLLRAYNAKITDHFYTTNRTDMEHAITNSGYVSQGDAGYVFNSADAPNSIPFYRAWNSRHVDHFYTTNETEREHAITVDNYADEGIVGYINPQSEYCTCGSEY